MKLVGAMIETTKTRRPVDIQVIGNVIIDVVRIQRYYRRQQHNIT